MTEQNALEINPEENLQFLLKRSSEDTAESTLTLTHPGTTDAHLAFKVKTTQPRRYLVRPNQGLIPPRGSETVTIILVEKDKQALLQSYDRLGQSALDHSKDKFLVQSCAVSPEFSQQYAQEKASGSSGKELGEALTSMWNAVSSSSNASIFNKKLHVKHLVPLDTTGATRSLPPPERPPAAAPLDQMSQEQMVSEITTLRRKYDELVAFSVNLTAERDILNNTLEQTKRDLNREMAARAALESKGKAGSAGGASRGSSSLVATLLPLLVIAMAAFLAGVKLTNEHQVDFLKDVPVVGSIVMETSPQEE